MDDKEFEALKEKVGMAVGLKDAAKAAKEGKDIDTQRGEFVTGWYESQGYHPMQFASSNWGNFGESYKTEFEQKFPAYLNRTPEEVAADTATLNADYEKLQAADAARKKAARERPPEPPPKLSAEAKKAYKAYEAAEAKKMKERLAVISAEFEAKYRAQERADELERQARLAKHPQIPRTFLEKLSDFFGGSVDGDARYGGGVDDATDSRLLIALVVALVIGVVIYFAVKAGEKFTVANLSRRSVWCRATPAPPSLWPSVF